MVQATAARSDAGGFVFGETRIWPPDPEKSVEFEG
jgi:hypothetical protein